MKVSLFFLVGAFITSTVATSPNSSVTRKLSSYLQSLDMANTKALSRQERKTAKRSARKKQAPKKPREYPRGSKKRKVKKMVRGQAKR